MLGREALGLGDGDEACAGVDGEPASFVAFCDGKLKARLAVEVQISCIHLDNRDTTGKYQDLMKKKL